MGYYAAQGRPETQEAFLAQLDARFEQQANALVSQVRRGIASSFSSAVTRVYFFILFIVAAGWFTTLAIPEYPLKKTFDRPAAAPAD